MELARKLSELDFVVRRLTSATGFGLPACLRLLELNIALLSTSYSNCAAIPMDAILGKAQQLQVDKQACH